jgi:glycosyltransferase involved in cell wall biosynthesis
LPGILPGCSKYAQEISTGFVNRGHSTTILTAHAVTGRGWADPFGGQYASKKEETINGVRVRRLKTRWQVSLAMLLLRKMTNGFLPPSLENIVSLYSLGPYLSSLDKEFREEGYDIVHVIAFPFGLVRLVWKACRSLGIPFLCTPLIHFEDPRHMNPLLWETLHDAAAVMACSNYERDQLIEGGIHPSKVHLIPMGINLDEWHGADGKRFKEKHRLEGNKIVLFAGTKAYDKGAIHLLHAVEGLSQQVSDLTFVSIGLSTREWERAKGVLRHGSLLDLGYVSDEEKRDAFDACDLFVMPSRYDSFGIVYLEAWRCGKPVIGARVGAIPEIIEDGKNGLLVEFGKVEPLAASIRYLLDHPALCREMGERGKDKVIRALNWGKNLPLIEQVYEQIRP